MDCRAFRKNHMAFVDDTLPGVAVGGMRDHLDGCPDCAALDQRVRRSLVMVRNNLVSIEPSRQFSDRLAARLTAERAARLASPLVAATPFRWSGLGVMGVVLALAGLSAVTVTLVDRDHQLAARLPEVVVAGPMEQSTLLPSATPAFAATMSSGMAILPALMLAEEVPVRRVNLEHGGATVRSAGLTVPSPDER